MQTFLPFASFAESAAVLDPRRLGKQRVEALQVLRGLIVPGYGWRRHPAVRMWAGYEEALVRYGLEMCRTWTLEGRADTCAATLMSDFLGWTPGVTVRAQDRLASDGDLPPWFGASAFHRSHQSALLRKEPDFYRDRFPGVPDDLPYVWPRSDRDPEPGPGPV
ncbi:cytoplasmic protein [Streptomyces agglomeratus]|uniref:Cytoplasmic protein n=1 Tax=Streptomyces agglomeratus TaxID=285458 RepID=A0A1E5PGI7_9ACTN|nr:MSMEG_6728 family protein [Streptomyces agglomeratus]OEJ28605.1 cytoplasmic protein [Streptomyces agglomeratus]OEJ37331.1 cytoplasmic protein [Streptomyces agglomeratus]OEJ48288.1 cytoplasmic protein [Streptomyces agglomeratus]OEJ49874.1 cytoplasmic protein [Streptomyces agglomeratus]